MGFFDFISIKLEHFEDAGISSFHQYPRWHILKAIIWFGHLHQNKKRMPLDLDAVKKIILLNSCRVKQFFTKKLYYEI